MIKRVVWGLVLYALLCTFLTAFAVSQWYYAAAERDLWRHVARTQIPRLQYRLEHLATKQAELEARRQALLGIWEVD